jgi:hypothetical protein
MIGEGDCGAIGGMKIGKGNVSSWYVHLDLGILWLGSQQRFAEIVFRVRIRNSVWTLTALLDESSSVSFCGYCDFFWLSYCPFEWYFLK